LIIDPGNEEAKKILYELYLHLDKNEEALNFINEFLIKDSNNVELLFAKANCLNDLGRIDDF
jgi:hypothetical protein